MEVYDNAVASQSILAAMEWRTVAETLMNNRNDMTVTSVTAQKVPQEFQVVFDRSQAAAFGGYMPDDPNVFLTSFKNMLVHIRPSF